MRIKIKLQFLCSYYLFLYITSVLGPPLYFWSWSVHWLQLTSKYAVMQHSTQRELATWPIPQFSSLSFFQKLCLFCENRTWYVVCRAYMPCVVITASAAIQACVLDAVGWGSFRPPTAQKPPDQFWWNLKVTTSFQCFDAIGWMAGRASSL